MRAFAFAIASTAISRRLVVQDVPHRFNRRPTSFVRRVAALRWWNVITNRKESEVLAGVLAYLSTRKDIFFWRQAAVTPITRFGQFTKAQKKGIADILCVQFPAGRFVGIECKRERGGKLSRDQVQFKNDVERCGGLFVEARGVKDVEIALGPYFCGYET